MVICGKCWYTTLAHHTQHARSYRSRFLINMLFGFIWGSEWIYMSSNNLDCISYQITVSDHVNSILRKIKLGKSCLWGFLHLHMHRNLEREIKLVSIELKHPTLQSTYKLLDLKCGCAPIYYWKNLCYKKVLNIIRSIWNFLVL